MQLYNNGNASDTGWGTVVECCLWSLPWIVVDGYHDDTFYTSFYGSLYTLQSHHINSLLAECE